MSHASFTIVSDTANHLLIRDEGPWDKYPTITNDADWVVSQLWTRLFGRMLLYIDSNGDIDQLLVRNGVFVGFRHPSKEEIQ